MKTLTFPKFTIYCIIRAVRYPRTPISFYYCSSCKSQFNINEKECPKCHDKVESSPDPRQVSPIPWWGSVGVIIIGIICWATMPLHQQVGLAEVGRALVYIPLGNIFGISIKTY